VGSSVITLLRKKFAAESADEILFKTDQHLVKFNKRLLIFTCAMCVWDTIPMKIMNSFLSVAGNSCGYIIRFK